MSDGQRTAEATGVPGCKAHGSVEPGCFDCETALNEWRRKKSETVGGSALESAHWPASAQPQGSRGKSGEAPTSPDTSDPCRPDAQTSEGAATPAGERASHEPSLSLADRGSEESAVLSGRSASPSKGRGPSATAPAGSPDAGSFSGGVMCWCDIDHDTHCIQKRGRSDAKPTERLRDLVTRFYDRSDSTMSSIELAMRAYDMGREDAEGDPCRAAATVDRCPDCDGEAGEAHVCSPAMKAKHRSGGGT